MSDFNKNKLLIIVSVMIAFTIVTAIKDNHWVGYLLSLVVFPLVTWGIIELMLKFNLIKHTTEPTIIYKKTTDAKVVHKIIVEQGTYPIGVKCILRKGKEIFVKQMMVGELDKRRCSPKFLSHNLPDETTVNVKCNPDGTLELRGKKNQYRIILEDKN
jgi:hypothetical protein